MDRKCTNLKDIFIAVDTYILKNLFALFQLYINVHAGRKYFLAEVIYFLILICTACITITKHMIVYNYNILFVVAEAVQHLCHQPS